MYSKYQEIADSLRSLIARRVYPPDSMLPTEQQLCQTYEVSRQTVRMALKCLVDDGLIQRRQGSGSRVLARSDGFLTAHKTVAIITTYISDYIFPRILREAESVLSANNCTTVLFATSNRLSDERRILTSLLEEKNLDGILVEGTKTALPNPNIDLYRKFQEQKIPLIFFNGNYKNLNTVSILDDNFAGGYQLVEYLISKGHKNIAGIFKNDDIQGHQRYSGFSKALCDHNLPLEDSNIFWYCTEDRISLNPQSSVWIPQISAALEGCTAVVCYNDEIASYLVKNLVARGMKIPGDMAVVSFDDSLYSDLGPCRITSLSHGSYNAGRTAAEALIQAFQGQEPESVLLPWELHEKESS